MGRHFEPRYSGAWEQNLHSLSQVFQKQPTTIYCRILPTLDHQVEISFSGSSDTNHDSLL